MTCLLYDLVGVDDRRMSPFCWRAKLALAHKGIPFETVAIKFTEKHRLAFSGQDQVPVLVDKGHTVHDSWAIACYLEDRYSDAPGLFSGVPNRIMTHVFNRWFDEAVTMQLFPLVLPDNFDVVLPEDLDYYTQSRKAWMGKTREQLLEERSEDSFVEWRGRLEVLREVLKVHDFLGGASPLFADYIVFSMFMWARAVSPWPVVRPGDVLYDWRERMLNLFDGMARRSKGYDY